VADDDDRAGGDQLLEHGFEVASELVDGQVPDGAALERVKVRTPLNNPSGIPPLHRID